LKITIYTLPNTPPMDMFDGQVFAVACQQDWDDGTPGHVVSRGFTDWIESTYATDLPPQQAKALARDIRRRLGIASSPQRRERIASAMIGNKNGKGRPRVEKPKQIVPTWKIADARGEVFFVPDLKAFCEQHDLSYAAFKKKSREGDRTQVQHGKSAGWHVLERRRRRWEAVLEDA